MAKLVYVVDCKACSSSVRVEVLGQAAVPPHNRASFYCPCCGSTETAREYRTGQHEGEYFYMLAEAMGLKATEEGAALAKSIYGLWDTDTHHRFMDFWREFDAEAQAESAAAS